MNNYTVVCMNSGEIFFESPFVYECERYIHKAKRRGCFYTIECINHLPKVVEYTDVYFELQMCAAMVQYALRKEVK